MLKLYQYITARSGRLLDRVLDRRLARGKEIADRVDEKKGIAALPRPHGPLLWLHAASVGEAQSALSLMNAILAAHENCHILITTGTRTSAEYLTGRLPDRCSHQFYPLDHPKWVRRFLDHWQPDMAIWMESELWPNMISQLGARAIPAVMMNASMSEKSFRRWRWAAKDINKLLSVFDLVCAQDGQIATKYKLLGARNVVTCGNLKYSAAPLPYEEPAFNQLQVATRERTLWVYASTHDGEEALACEVHHVVKETFPDLLTIIVPRHPERGPAIQDLCEQTGLDTVRRRDLHRLPDADTDIYVADTIGELGLFYRFAPVAMIGRSFSNDGGGGHNPIEAAQLGAAVLSGPDVENLQEIFDLMWESGAALRVDERDQLAGVLQDLLVHGEKLETLRQSGQRFAEDQIGVVVRVMDALAPFLNSILKKPDIDEGEA